MTESNKQKRSWIEQFENTISIVDTIYGRTYIVTIDTITSSIIDIQPYKVSADTVDIEDYNLSNDELTKGVQGDLTWEQADSIIKDE